MATFLSDEWFTALTEAAADIDAGQVDAVVQFVVSGSPDGKVQFTATIERGRLVSLEAGKVKGATAVVTWKFDDAAAIFGGDLDPDEAFMSGQTKVEGDYLTYLTDLRPFFGREAMVALSQPLR